MYIIDEKSCKTLPLKFATLCCNEHSRADTLGFTDKLVMLELDSDGKPIFKYHRFPKINLARPKRGIQKLEQQTDR